MTRRTIAFTGHITASPLHARPMTSPCTPFFWVVKVSDANRACLRRESGSVSKFRRVSPMKSCTFSRRNGCLSVSPSLSVYSPGRRTQKEEEGQDDHVGNGSAKWGSKCGVGDAGNAAYDLDRDWFDSVGR